MDYKRAADDAASLLDLIGGVSGLSKTGNSWYAQTNEINNLQSGECPKEIIWRGNKTNGADDWDLGLNQEADNFPPSLYGKGRINPTQNLVDAFPAANGYPITDERSEYDDLDPYSNRDPRLDLYIIYNGCKYKGATINTDITTANNDNGLNKIGNSTRTGYYMKKLLVRIVILIQMPRTHSITILCISAIPRSSWIMLRLPMRLGDLRAMAHMLILHTM